MSKSAFGVFLVICILVCVFSHSINADSYSSKIAEVNPGNCEEIPERVLIDSQNNIYIIAEGTEPIYSTPTIIKYNSDGVLSWVVKEVHGVPFEAFIQDAYLFFGANAMSGWSSIVLAKLNKNGKTIWKSRFRYDFNYNRLKNDFARTLSPKDSGYLDEAIGIGMIVNPNYIIVCANGGEYEGYRDPPEMIKFNRGGEREKLNQYHPSNDDPFTYEGEAKWLGEILAMKMVEDQEKDLFVVYYMGELNTPCW